MKRRGRSPPRAVLMFDQLVYRSGMTKRATWILAFMIATTGAEAASRADVDARLDAVFGSHEDYDHFLAGLQFAAAKRDAYLVAEYVEFPITVTVGGKPLTLNGYADFIDAFDKVMPPHVLKAIVDQTYETLFVNDEGVMIGNGEVWFSMTMSDDAVPEPIGIKVTAINP